MTPRKQTVPNDPALKVLFKRQEELGWTDLKLAQIASTYPHYISRYRHGHKTPKFWDMVNLLDAVGVNVRFEPRDMVEKQGELFDEQGSPR